MELNYIDLFDRAARIAAGRDALVDDGGALTYAEAWVRANRIASALVARGFGPSTRFAIFSPNCSAAMLAMLAGLKAGGAWCNINVRNAIRMNVDILARGKCEAVFFHSSTAPLVETIRAGVPTLRFAVCVDQELPGFDSLAALARAGSDAPINVRLAPDAVGFQGSTGGTTGAPKITQGGQAFLTWNAIGFMTEFHFDRPPVNLAVAPITHAGGIVAMATLALGGTVVFMATADLGKLLDAIAAHRVSLLFLPPTLIYMLLGHEALDATDLSSLQCFWYGAAPMSTARLEEAMSRIGPVMAQLFGQTEAPMMVSMLPPAEHFDADGKVAVARLASAGRPAPLVRVGIMDPDSGVLMPNGERGEIVVRSSLVMAGYYKDPAATEAAARFGWHHTGDIGYLDDDGYLFIVDRLKDMIITGGFNVYSAEVEQALMQHPAVRDCAVIGLPDEKWGEQVTAVVEAKPGAEVETDELIAFVKARIGSVKAPKRVELWKELPRSRVGKVLKMEVRTELLGVSEH